MSDFTVATDLKVQQPIHPSFIDKLDAEYIEFHNARLINLVPPHTLPWSPSIRDLPAVPGGSAPLPVGKVQDFDITHAKVRAFTPPGEVPAGGWPVFIFFHGGGWTLGNISSENSFCTRMCVGASSVVISVDYRLGPENPYPAAVEDAVDALLWTVRSGASILNLNLARLAVGGSSSGGNLAAILSLKATQLQPPIPIIFQLLIVPVTDNSASVDTSVSWKNNQYTPWLSPERMLWFRRSYLPNEADWSDRSKWDASPLFAPKALLKGSPKTWIAVAELDILCGEGVEYGARLRELGVEVEVEVYKGAPHPIMAMDGVLSIGKRLVSDAATQLSKALS